MAPPGASMGAKTNLDRQFEPSKTTPEWCKFMQNELEVCEFYSSAGRRPAVFDYHQITQPL